MNPLLKLRKKSGLTQQALAGYIGVSRGLINLAEKGLRELPKEAGKKLANIENVIATDEFSRQPAATTLDDKKSKKLKEYHKLKIEEYLYKAQGLRLQLSAMQKARQNTDAKVKLLSGLSKNNPKTGKNKFGSVWTKYHEQESNGKLSKYIYAIQMLTYDIEVLMGYAAVHEKILEKIF